VTEPVGLLPLWLRCLPPFLRKRLDDRPELIAIVSNSGWLIFDKLIRMVLGLAVGSWVARYLGPARYGELAYALAYVALFQVLASLGLDGIVIRDISRDKARAGDLLAAAFCLRLFSGFFCWLVAIVLIGIFNGWESQTIIIVSLVGGSLVFQVADTVDLWFQSQCQSRRTVVVKLLSYVLVSGVKVALIIANASLVVFSAVIAFEAFVSAVGLFWAYRKYPVNNGLTLHSNVMKEILAESWPYAIRGLGVIASMRLDQILLKIYSSERELGFFVAAVTLGSLLILPAQVVMPSISPYFAKVRAKSAHDFYILLSKLFRVLLFVSLLLSFLFLFASNLLVAVVYGNDFSQAGSVLSVYVFSTVFLYLGWGQELWIVNENKKMVGLTKMILGLVVTLLIGPFLIDSYGAMGAAFTTVISYSVSAYFSNIILCPKIFALQSGFAHK